MILLIFRHVFRLDPLVIINYKKIIISIIKNEIIYIYIIYIYKHTQLHTYINTAKVDNPRGALSVTLIPHSETLAQKTFFLLLAILH